MGRILAIDYGLKRTGIAVTDPLKIIATPLDTIQTASLITFLKVYSEKEEIELFVIGMPKTLDNQDSSIASHVRGFIKKISKILPTIPIQEVDERFTSSIAQKAIIEAGVKKKDRQNKSTIDKISATLILQEYLNSH